MQNRSVSQRNVELSFVADLADPWTDRAVLVRDCSIVRVDEYRTVEEALEAVGRPQEVETAPPGERSRF